MLLKEFVCNMCFFVFIWVIFVFFVSFVSFFLGCLLRPPSSLCSRNRRNRGGGVVRRLIAGFLAKMTGHRRGLHVVFLCFQTGSAFEKTGARTVVHGGSDFLIFGGDWSSWGGGFAASSGLWDAENKLVIFSVTWEESSFLGSPKYQEFGFGTLCLKWFFFWRFFRVPPTPASSCRQGGYPKKFYLWFFHSVLGGRSFIFARLVFREAFWGASRALWFPPAPPMHSTLSPRSNFLLQTTGLAVSPVSSYFMHFIPTVPPTVDIFFAVCFWPHTAGSLAVASPLTPPK